MIILAFAESAIQLVPDGTILIHLFIILVMVAILNRTLFRPVNKVLAEREAQTSGRLAEAKALRTELENKSLRYQQGLRDARTASYRMVEQERTEALREREARMGQIREEIRAWIDDQKSELKQEADTAREALGFESRQSGVQISSQILQRSVSDSG